MDNKAPGNNGIGKKIRNIGMAAVAAVTLGVGGKHVVEKNNKIEEETRTETKYQKNESEKLRPIPSFYLRHYITSDVSYSETKEFFKDAFSSYRQSPETVEGFDERAELKVLLQQRLIELADTKIHLKDLLDSNLIVDASLRKVLEEKYNNSLN